MNIPESISKLTIEKVNDTFNTKPIEPALNVEETILLLKRSLNFKHLENFEKGLNYFKTNATSDRAVVLNFISLLSEILLLQIKNSQIQEEFKVTIASTTKHSLNSVSEATDALFKNLSLLNKENNLLDVNNFTLIILGYALGLLKKNHSSRD